LAGAGRNWLSVFYRVIDGGIEIVRVLSGFRDIMHIDLS
jgi:hypothetical protein